MSEILEKLILIGFGLTILLILSPILNPLLSINIGINEDYYSEAQEDLQDFKLNLIKFENQEDKTNNSFSFSFSGEIIILIYSRSQNNTELRFFFYINETQTPFSTIVPIKGTYTIDVKSITIRYYLLGVENNSMFLIFY